MPNVTVEWLQGRSLDERREVVKGITDVLVEQGRARREAVQVTFIEITKETWGRGGLLGCDRDDVHP
ncbi:MAG TPA: tautomerase family protein [Gaiellaceae bacterium]|nr:tautomerase family protein [Gaiellaceae bacterium]